MKKVGFVLLAVFAVLAIVLAAGCINTPAGNPTPTPTQSQGQAASDVPALAITIEKTGVTYNIGDTMDVVLPSNPSTGYSWSVKSADNGLEVTEIPSNAANTSNGLVGAPTTQRFAVKGVDKDLKVGETHDHSFTLVYKKAGEEAGIYEYTDVLHVKKTDDEPMVPRSVFKFEGAQYTVSKGQKVTVTVSQNSASTGYQWFAQNTTGLKISEPVLKNNAQEGMVGVPGTCTWTITSDTPGAYYFTALYQRGWETDAEPAGRIIVPICFTVE